MKTFFDKSFHLIRIESEIEGPKGRANILLALDTGASQTLPNSVVLATWAVIRSPAHSECL